MFGSEFSWMSLWSPDMACAFCLSLKLALLPLLAQQLLILWVSPISRFPPYHSRRVQFLLSCSAGTMSWSTALISHVHVHTWPPLLLVEYVRSSRERWGLTSHMSTPASVYQMTERSGLTSKVATFLLHPFQLLVWGSASLIMRFRPQWGCLEHFWGHTSDFNGLKVRPVGKLLNWKSHAVLAD